MYDRPFRWWVQSVMPLVFDDSLSYYEVLAKLTKYIEGLTGDVEQIEKILGTIEGIEDITQFTEFLERIQAEIGNLNNLQTDTKASLVSAINEVALKADIAYWKPPTGIPESDLSQEVKDKLNKTGEATKYIINNVELKAAPNNNSPTDLGLGTYSVPSGGIPWDTLSQDVKDRINAGGGGTGGTSDYTELINKPQINGHTLNAGNNTTESLGLGTYSKPSTGIPESDLSAEVQEKLNTSGGIADDEISFVATREYNPGELVYINGTLYKVVNKILPGSNMVPGNNIVVTDISSEIERIDDEIDSLQSGAGPDSWNLSATVQSFSNLEKVDFFEYFNCTGGESYNFIVEPVNPSTAAAYILEIRKRDGTVVLTQTVTNSVDYMNRKRFTFAPEDSGEYYCTFYRNASGYASDLSAVKVTIEYTQSQGMTELWNKVNEAISVSGDIDALNQLTAQHTEQLAELDDIPDRVTALETSIDSTEQLVYSILDDNNLFDGNLATDGGRLTATGGWVSDANCFYTNYISVVAGEKYVKNSPIEDGFHRLCIYNANKGFISATSQNTVTIPQSGAFVRFCGYLTEKDTTEFIRIAIKGIAELEEQKLDKPKVYTEILGSVNQGLWKYTDGTTVENSSYVYEVVSNGFVAGKKYAFDCYQPSSNTLYAAIVFYNNSDRIETVLLSKGVGYEKYEYTVPDGTTSIYITGIKSQDSGRMYSIEYSDDTAFYDKIDNNSFAISNWIDRNYWDEEYYEYRLKTSQEIDHLVIAFVVDDSLPSMSRISDKFLAVNAPLCLATVPGRLSDVCENDKTVKEICEDVQLAGGEILVHNSFVIGGGSTDDAYNRYFVKAKRKLYDNGFNVNGIVKAGGTEPGGAPDTTKVLKFLRSYYDYGSGFATATGAKYNFVRGHLQDGIDFESLKATLSTTTGVRIMYTHGANDFPNNANWANDIGDLVDYILNSIEGAEIVTYRKIFKDYCVKSFKS